MTGRCANGRGCAGYDKITKLAAVAESSRICDPCADRAARDIVNLPRDYAALADELTPVRRGLSQRVAGGETGAPVPISLGIEALQRDIFWALTTWEPIVRHVAGLPAAPLATSRDAYAVVRAAQVIACRVPLLANVETTSGWFAGLAAGNVRRDGVWALQRLRTLRATARAVCGLTRLTHVLPGDCSGCGAAALRRDDGSETVHCDACSRRWTWDDYRRYVGLILESKR